MVDKGGDGLYNRHGDGVGMRVELGRLRETKGASLAAVGTVSLSDPGSGFRMAGPVDVTVTIVNTGRFIHAEGRISARLTSECVRCLAPVDLRLDLPFAQDYASAGQAIPAGESENDFLTFADDILDLDPAVSETVLLNLPMKPLCREDCPGLCPSCGRDLKLGNCSCRQEPSHPGLTVLARLQDKKEVQ